jgi:hypothetical protein
MHSVHVKSSVGSHHSEPTHVRTRSTTEAGGRGQKITAGGAPLVVFLARSVSIQHVGSSLRHTAQMTDRTGLGRGSPRFSADDRKGPANTTCVARQEGTATTDGQPSMGRGRLPPSRVRVVGATQRFRPIFTSSLDARSPTRPRLARTRTPPPRLDRASEKGGGSHDAAWGVGAPYRRRPAGRELVAVAIGEGTLRQLLEIRQYSSCVTTTAAGIVTHRGRAGHS